MLFAECQVENRHAPWGMTFVLQERRERAKFSGVWYTFEGKV
jgi:hypothetical protein